MSEKKIFFFTIEKVSQLSWQTLMDIPQHAAQYSKTLKKKFLERLSTSRVSTFAALLSNETESFPHNM